VETTVRTKPFS